MSDKFNITLKVAGKVFPLPIERAKEERYRRAEREVNAVIDRFRKLYRAEDDEYLAMAALQMAVNCVELELRGSMDSDEEKLKAIENQLDQYLNEI